MVWARVWQLPLTGGVLAWEPTSTDSSHGRPAPHHAAPPSAPRPVHAGPHAYISRSLARPRLQSRSVRVHSKVEPKAYVLSARFLPPTASDSHTQRRTKFDRPVCDKYDEVASAINQLSSEVLIVPQNGLIMQVHEQIILTDGQEQPISRTYQYRKVSVILTSLIAPRQFTIFFFFFISLTN